MKKVSIKESDLVNLIEEIAMAEVEAKKAEWLAEQKKIWIKETKIQVNKKLVERIQELESKLLK